jgi:ATP-dependent Clp protease ATP-binding subunit ClpC
MGIFDRFTEKAQRVLILAQEEALRLKHNYIGTEHILLGLLKEGEGIAAQVLMSRGANLEDIRERVINAVGMGTEPVKQVLGHTARTKNVIETSVGEARALGHNYVGTEHLLLALLREKDGIAAQILESIGIGFDNTQGDVVKQFGGETHKDTKENIAKNVKTPNLDQYGRDLTVMAKEGKIDPIIGRDKETQRVIQILSRRTKNNPIHLFRYLS